GVALNSACTNLDANGLRRHIRSALRAGATREEILLVLKMASVMSIDSCMLATPIHQEEASEGELDAAGTERAKRLKRVDEATPAVDKTSWLEQAQGRPPLVRGRSISKGCAPGARSTGQTYREAPGVHELFLRQLSGR